MTIALTTIKLYLHGPSATLACEIVLTKKLEKKRKYNLVANKHILAMSYQKAYISQDEKKKSYPIWTYRTSNPTADRAHFFLWPPVHFSKCMYGCVHLAPLYNSLALRVDSLINYFFIKIESIWWKSFDKYFVEWFFMGWKVGSTLRLGFFKSPPFNIKQRVDSLCFYRGLIQFFTVWLRGSDCH